MKISAIDVTLFTYPTQRRSDSAGHSHPGPETDAQMALLTITSDEGDCGYAFAPAEVVRSHVVNAFFRKVLIGQNAFDRERLWQDLVHWQRGSAHQLTERALSAVEQAMWDLIGRKLQQPVHKLLGGYREKIPAYGSTMCGDELEGDYQLLMNMRALLKSWYSAATKRSSSTPGCRPFRLRPARPWILKPVRRYAKR